MKRIFFIGLLVILLGNNALAQTSQVKKIKLTELQQMISEADDELTIFNFWATWCHSCVEELPHFKKLEEKNKKIKIIYVSLDYSKNYEKLRDFASKNMINSEVYLLDEKNPANYIPKISKKWTGTIPASLFVNEFGKQSFYERGFSEKQLFSLIEKKLKK